MLEFLLASLEVIRRGHWNFYRYNFHFEYYLEIMLLVFITNKILRHRIENEHLNNVGKFRAVKTVPLPFRETDSDG